MKGSFELTICFHITFHSYVAVWKSENDQLMFLFDRVPCDFIACRSVLFPSHVLSEWVVGLCHCSHAVLPAALVIIVIDKQSDCKFRLNCTIHIVHILSVGMDATLW